MKRKSVFLTQAAVIAAAYAALTYLSAAFGLAYGQIQFRISEALCILPLFTPAAVPGLAVGCLLANIISTVNPLDMIIGTSATLAAAVAARALAHVCIRDFPLLSFSMPVIINAVGVGAEIAFFTSEASFPIAFILSALSVFAGEAAVVFTLGTALFFAVNKSAALKKILS